MWNNSMFCYIWNYFQAIILYFQLENNIQVMLKYS